MYSERRTIRSSNSADHVQLASWPTLEKELRRGWEYLVTWPGRQDDIRDRRTRFIYHIFQFDKLVSEIDSVFGDDPNYCNLRAYTLNRWYSHWSHVAAEELFCLHSEVERAEARDPLVDFTICGVPFDLKLSRFPSGFGEGIEFATDNPALLVDWLYRNQSQGQRKHFENRLYMVLYSHSGDHARLKAEISRMKPLIDEYVRAFKEEELIQYQHDAGTAKSDIIWVIDEKQ